MSEPNYIYVPGMSDAEGELFELWQERLHEIALAEGRKLCLMRDGVPILVGIIAQRHPRKSLRSRANIAMRLMDVAMQATRTARETAGHA